MRFSVLTLFPEMIRNTLETSITGKALEKGLFELETIQIRDHAVNSYGKVDDYVFGGGKGMLLMAEPVYQSWLDAVKCYSSVHADTEFEQAADSSVKRARTIYLSPKGRRFDQEAAARIAKQDHVILLCGHYEGIDQRVLDQIVDEEISLGDFVLTGGELAACVVIDAAARLLPGVLPAEEAYMNESHMSGLLEQPHYTRPSEWQGREVPEILLSGHQARIERWQYLRSLMETLDKRPDLLRSSDLKIEDWEDLIVILQEDKNRK